MINMLSIKEGPAAFFHGQEKNDQFQIKTSINKFTQKGD